ncbi:MAG: N-acetylmuramoyl-L-alanine amidase [Verrucomicrobia bacterium]|nr:MAG: N-acetylmuramoyl-L-alanine amidase [Verrucomicrobiota bacterium]
MTSSLLRRLLALALSLWLVSPARAEPWEWEIIDYKKVPHIPAESVKEFYRFDSLDRSGSQLVFRQGTGLLMRWVAGSDSIRINGIKFSLSYPVIEHEGRVLVSRLDLQKLLDPVLRPSYIQNTKPFDTVIVDAGHGGDDSGARSVRGTEKSYALDTAKRLAGELQKLGYKVRLIRTADRFVSLSERVEAANQIKDAIFVSVHFNSGLKPEADGIETFALAPAGGSSDADGSATAASFSGNHRDGENIALATAVHAMVVQGAPSMTDRGVKRARYNVLRGINKPAILVEGGFLTNAKDALKVDSVEYRAALARCIALGIRNFNKATGAPLPGSQSGGGAKGKSPR